MANKQQPYRTIWISDLHLGTRGCKAEMLLDFLRRTRSEKLYLVGDVIDGWRIRRSPYWSAAQGEVVRNLIKKTREGTHVVYLPGNHDESVRGFLGLQFAGIDVHEEVVHETADGKRLLVLHGDQFDSVMLSHRWLAFLGDHAYRFALWGNHWFNVARRTLGYNYWSLSAYLKHKVKNAVDFIFKFEEMLADHARKSGLDGVVCGHIHQAELKEVHGVLYANDGDWVESCTALVEHFDGRLEILDWPSLMADQLAREQRMSEDDAAAEHQNAPADQASGNELEPSA
ncbi:MAG: UDP-2,3-diacylglucosamine diphosphatase [Planctomycetota bacterium]